MNNIAEAFEDAGMNQSTRAIQQGTIIALKDDLAEEYIRNSFGQPPHFVTKKFRQESRAKRGYAADEHFWIFLKTYQKRKGSGKVKIVNRSSLKDGQSNRKPHDRHQFPHADIDPEHSNCKIDKEGLWKSELPENQKLDKGFLENFGPASEHYVCIDPQTDKIIAHFKKLNETYE
jgi:hypothetical protein